MTKVIDKSCRPIRLDCGYTWHALEGKKVKISWIAVTGTPSPGYGVSLAIMGSHSVTFHPTQVNTPWLNPCQRPVGPTRFTYPRGLEGWVDLGDRLHAEMVYPSTGGHPSEYQPDSARPGIELTTCWSQVRCHSYWTSNVHVGCHLPARHADWFTYRRVMEGWDGLSDFLHAEMVYPSTGGHPSKYQPDSARPGIELARNLLITSPMP